MVTLLYKPISNVCHSTLFPYYAVMCETTWANTRKSMGSGSTFEIEIIFIGPNGRRPTQNAIFEQENHTEAFNRVAAQHNHIYHIVSV